MPFSRSPSPPPAGDRRVGSVGVVAAAALLSLATLLPEAVASLLPGAPHAAGKHAHAPGAAAAAFAPEGQTATGDGGDAAPDGMRGAGRHG